MDLFLLAAVEALEAHLIIMVQNRLGIMGQDLSNPNMTVATGI